MDERVGDLDRGEVVWCPISTEHASGVKHFARSSGTPLLYPNTMLL